MIARRGGILGFSRVLEVADKDRWYRKRIGSVGDTTARCVGSAEGSNPDSCPSLSQKILENASCISPLFVQKRCGRKFGVLGLIVSSTCKKTKNFPFFLAKSYGSQLRFPVALPAIIR